MQRSFHDKITTSSRWAAAFVCFFGLCSPELVSRSSAQSEASSEVAPKSESIDFVRDIQPIFKSHCYACHGPTKQKSGFRLDIKSQALRGGENYGPLIDPVDPASSPLLELICHPNPQERMPPPGPTNPPLSDQQIETLKAWIKAGAPWPDGIDDTVLVDPKLHWSFQPLPEDFDPTISIDALIEKKLKISGLEFSPETKPMQWLRRVSLDLHGLPPDPDLVRWFELHSGESDAYEQVVSTLLGSPRYAERWAQHWLDVVRYADTHGFEVNTERPHAWHYRDYVIRALDQDTPFHDFIRQQIAGDQLGHDTATGFLITASVLLPGQIGADEPSKRLARQDAIDEIVVNIGQAFLGLSIGCARCHDHKFDPITQRDYYAMQAFVSGVDYEDRVVNTPWAVEQKTRQHNIHLELQEIDRRLLQYEPIASPNAQSVQLPSSNRNVIEFEPQSARFVKFEIWNSNLHPTLGLIEPCIDELEVWTSGENPINIGLAEHGTQATASGSRNSEVHQLKHIHDGKTGNASSWMSDQAGRGWVRLELPTEATLSKIVWGRDRLGQFNDRTPTAYRIQIGTNLEELRQIAAVRPQRTVIQPTMNSDRIAPTRTKGVRFTILDTNNLEPCVDEFEIYNASGENIALANYGTTVTSSGDNVSLDRHELRFVHDGNYGNSRSWMSNANGQGCLTFEFPTEETVERFVWGRDRQGQFQDRLAIRYRIETLSNQGVWETVCDDSDRIAYPKDPGAPKPPSTPNIATYDLSPEDSKTIEELERKQKRLREEYKAAEESQKAFAGRFRSPDRIHWLNRGDPEQPKDPVAPHVPEFFGELKLDESAAESERRLALANWIASARNPLTPRVIANRVWQGHFGVGLVETPNDFGLNGMPPTHPELLDWLSRELIHSGWSLKSLHRKIVLSRTYRQSSQSNEKGSRIDRDTRLLWRYPSRRLEAETIRDSMLFVSGQLNLQMFGRGFDLFAQRGGLSGFNPIEQYKGDGLKRMIYAHKIRREREAVFGAFDCPDAGQSTGLRRVSTTPIQALNLLNSQFTIDQSSAFAESIQSQSGSTPRAWIDAAYQRCLMRSPSAEEIQDALPIVEEHGLEVLCRALFNCNEFLFIP